MSELHRAQQGCHGNDQAHANTNPLHIVVSHQGPPGCGGETRLMIRHRQAFHQFPKRYHTILDFSLFPLYPPPYGTNAPGETLALLPCGAPAGKGTIGKAKDTCILNKRCLLRNQLTPARKRDTRKRAPSELYQERFL